MSAQKMSGSGSSPSPSGGGTPPSGGSMTTGSLSTPARKRTSQVAVGVAVGIGVVLLVAGLGGGYFLGSYLAKTTTPTVDITETGSTLLEPMMAIWGPAYTNTVNSHVVVSVTGGGSGQGQSESEAGSIDIGASDAYTTTTVGVVDVPVAISSQLVVYNLGTTLNKDHLNLNGTMVAEIFEGNLCGATPGAAIDWNCGLIQAANPSVTLPATAITPVVRSDSSGDTDLISTYCDMSYKGWTYGNSTKAFINTVPPNAKTGDGNAGILSQLVNITGGVGYVGISYLSQIEKDGLGWANLGDNYANSYLGGDVAVNASATANYIAWSIKDVSEDANLSLSRLNYAADGLALNMVLGGSPAGATTWSVGGGGTNPTATDPTPYPDANLEYSLIKTSPSDPAHQAYVVAFEEWVISYGNAHSYVSQVNFVALTPQLQGLDLEALSEVHIAN